MADMSKHKRAENLPRHNSPVPALWTVLLSMGTVSVAFQMWHAMHSGSPVWIAVLIGVAPVLASMGLTHAAALARSSTPVKVMVYGVIVGAMGLSMNAIAQVVRPAEGPVAAWVFGIVLDAAAIAALTMILKNHERVAAEREAEAAAAEQAAAAAVPVAVVPARTKPASSARTKSSGSARTRKPSGSGQRLSGWDKELADLKAEDAVRTLLRDNPSMGTKALCDALGWSDSYVRRIKRRMKERDTGTVAATGPIQRVS